jgi:hypothetical protein
MILKKPGYDEMLEYLDSAETRAAFEKITKIVKPFNLCSMCKRSLVIGSVDTMEKYSRVELQYHYDYVKNMIAKLEVR